MDWNAWNVSKSMRSKWYKRKAFIDYLWRMLRNQPVILKTGKQRERNSCLLNYFLYECYIPQGNQIVEEGNFPFWANEWRKHDKIRI